MTRPAGAAKTAMSKSLHTFPVNAPKPLAVAVVLLVLLSGCAGAGSSSDESSAAASPKTSAPTTPTPAPAPTPGAVYKPASAEGPAENVPLPKMSEAAKKETEAGLEDFAKYFFQLINYGYETGDVEPVKKLSGPNCVSCMSYYGVVESGFQDDDWLTGARIHLHSISSGFVKSPRGSYQLVIDISQEPITYYRPGEAYGPPESNSSGVQVMEATFEDGAWFANAMSTLAMDK